MDLAPASFQLTEPPKIHGSAAFSRDRTCRNEIRRWWVPEPKRWVAWLMLNPSLAGAKKGDPTAGRVTHFSRAWGYDGWIGVNLYPLISSKPAEMWRWAAWDKNGPDWYARDDIHHNADHIEKAGRAAALRMVAFGAEPVRRDNAWLEECIEAFGQPADNEGADERLYCLGTNAAGQPLHPIALERHGYAKARRIGMVAMIGGKDKEKIRDRTPLPFRDVLLGIARDALPSATPVQP